MPEMPEPAQIPTRKSVRAARKSASAAVESTRISVLRCSGEECHHHANHAGRKQHSVLHRFTPFFAGVLFGPNAAIGGSAE
jgi:hypothetical protein